MKKISKLIILIILCMLSTSLGYAQKGDKLIENAKDQGVINNNMGVIRVKNTGKLVDMPKYVGGTVIFQAQHSGEQQIVPNITYNKLILNSSNWLYIDSCTQDGSKADSKEMTVLDSFIIKSGSVTKLRNNKVETFAKANVFNNGVMHGTKDLVMNGEKGAQSINGADSGVFSRLRIENPDGVDVTGNFTVDNKLELKLGQLRNDSFNIRIGNDTLDRINDTMDVNNERAQIIRWTTSSIKNRGEFPEQTVDIQYLGRGSMHTGGEIPPVNKDIYGLRVENTDSLILSENVRAIDNMYMATHVHTGDDDTLTLASIKNPVYKENASDAEVHGHFRRTGWLDGDTILFNNPYTKLVFRTPVSRNSISQLVSTSFPSRYHDIHNANLNKVHRMLAMNGLDDNGNRYTDSIDAEYHYGWRNLGVLDETMNLAFDRLMLLYHDGTNWLPNKTSIVPATHNYPNMWGYSYAVDLSTFGNLAIGYMQNYLAFSGKAVLEGAYRYKTATMSNELQQKGYLPMPPADVYPYNTDPNRLYYTRPDGQFPDSVVDWVVVELRKDFAIEGEKKTFLLKQDGRIVDMWGNEQIFFKSNGAFATVDSTGEPSINDMGDEDNKEAQLYVLVKHRNHAAVISDKPVHFLQSEQNFVDMSSPTVVLGGTGSLKAIDRVADNSNQFIYGMLAGDINDMDNTMMPNGIIDSYDYQTLLDAIANWSIETLDGYLLNDVSLSGTINTVDYNLIFNNRNRILWYSIQ